jgi:hypothetical protein
LLVPLHPALAQFNQQGGKLVGTGAVAPTGQGNAITLSADGNTAVVGGYLDNGNIGGVWVFTRSGGVWGPPGGTNPPGGTKLPVGTGAVGAAHQGTSVAISGDGHTIIVGGFSDNGNVGAAWVYTGSGSNWTQQAKLVATGGVGIGPVGAALQGTAVALSNDGNTAIVGGDGDNDGTGAAWLWTRSGGNWTQGSKLVGTLNSGASLQGSAVALSSDGSTAIVGGYSDGGHVGAAWVFTVSGGVGTQQGAKLAVIDPVGATNLGIAVALSSDGNTAIVGGNIDNANTGAAWVFTRSGSVWTQQGLKLVGTGAVGAALQGSAVALSADGNTAIVGGYGDNSFAGAVWVFTRSGSVWTQYGSKLIGSGAVGAAYQGISVALSSDGSTAIMGGTRDNTNVGAAWAFNAHVAHDFNGDRKSDILFRNSSSGAVVGWQMNGSTVTQSTVVGTMPTNWQIVAQRDFDGDGKTDILWRDTTAGTVVLWLMNGLTVSQTFNVGTVPTHWVLAGASDFNGDGKADLLWRDSSTGTVAIWLMNGGTVVQTGTVGTVPLSWSIIGTTANGGIGWRNTSGALALWSMNGFTATSHSLGTVANVWAVVGVGDFDGNGSDDLLFRNSTSGALVIWFLTDGVFTSSANVATVANSWSVSLTGDFDGDGKSDILWTNTSGARTIWFMNGATVASSANIGTTAAAWVVQSNSAE